MFLKSVEMSIYIHQSLHPIFSMIYSGLFTVIGGAIPIVLILLFLFFRTRSNFRNSIPSEREFIQKYQELLDTEESQLRTLNKKIQNNEIAPTDEIFSFQLQLQSSINQKKQEIVLRTIWIGKVESATFLGWVGYYFVRSYFSDYFKK